MRYSPLGEFKKNNQASIILLPYLECILWAESDGSDDQGGEALDRNYSISDFSINSIEKANKDCEDFLEKARDILEQYSWSESNVGHNFWLNRNGHGSGFWDDYCYTPEDRKKLDEIASSFSECYVYIGENEEIEVE